MSKSKEIGIIKYVTNFQRLQAIKLKVTDFIFFEWLIYRQVGFNLVPFYYQARKIEEELNLTSKQINLIIKKFVSMGILSVENKTRQETGGKNRFFLLSFSEVNKQLNKIYKEDTEYYKYIKDEITKLEREQKQTEKGKLNILAKNEITHKVEEEVYYNTLCQAWRDRIEMYNDGELTETPPKRYKSPTKLVKNKTILNRLYKAVQQYDIGTINNAFVAFSDYFITNKVKADIKNPLLYFLTWKTEEQAFTIINKYLNIYIKKYSCRKT